MKSIKGPFVLLIAVLCQIGCEPEAFAATSDRSTVWSVSAASHSRADAMLLNALEIAIADIRKAHEAQALARSPRLDRLASLQAAAIAGEGRLTHEDADGRDLPTRFEEAGIRYHQIGENLALITGNERVLERAIRSWMASAAHRSNILNPAFEETGFGIANRRAERFIVQIFLKARTRSVRLDKEASSRSTRGRLAPEGIDLIPKSTPGERL